jgi:hypothetical protein
MNRRVIFYEVVKGLMQRNRRSEIFQIFAESVREPGLPKAVHRQRTILSFNVACGEQINFRMA